MQKVASNIRSLLTRTYQPFSKDIFVSNRNPIKDRVMSTPTWPVPYYERISKAYPIRGTSTPTQRRPNPTSAALTCLRANPPGSMPSAP